MDERKKNKKKERKTQRKKSRSRAQNAHKIVLKCRNVQTKCLDNGTHIQRWQRCKERQKMDDVYMLTYPNVHKTMPKKIC